jgi:CRP/FNR family transcriptional regulator, anaerobic regulatory protein
MYNICTYSGVVMENQCQKCARASVCLGFNAFEFPARLLKRGEHLCYQGQQSQNLYILRSGILKSYITKADGEEFVMGFYFPPDLFGWEGIDESHRSISITALDQSNICVVPTEKMFQLTQKIPTIGTQLLRMVSRRIQQDNTALLRTTAQQRVATFLLQLELRYRQLGFPKQSFQLIMTHQDIANYLRITPSTISRILHELQRKKLISIEKHIVKLLNISAISLMAECA